MPDGAHTIGLILFKILKHKLFKKNCHTFFGEGGPTASLKGGLRHNWKNIQKFTCKTTASKGDSVKV